MAGTQRLTFRQIVEEARVDAAETAWSRARLISRLRHQQRNFGRRSTANRLATLKADAIRLALSLAPEQITVTVDDDYQVGRISVRWPGHGKLHLPANTRLA